MYKELNLCFAALILAIVGGKPVTNRTCDQQSIVCDIRRLQKGLPHYRDQLFTPKNIVVGCASKARKCFMLEIEFLEDEHESNENITNIIQRIQRSVGVCWERHEEDAIKNECPRCRSYEKQTSDIFLNHMIGFVQSSSYTGF